MDTDIMLHDNDISSTQSGDISLVSDTDNILQTIISNILTRYGELELDPTRGNMIYNRRVKLTNSGLKQVEEDCKNAILQDPRISRVLSISAIKSNTTSYQCDIQFSAMDINNNIINSMTVITLI